MLQPRTQSGQKRCRDGDSYQITNQYKGASLTSSQYFLLCNGVGIFILQKNP